MLDPWLIILSYALLGAGIKYADQAYDIDVFNKKAAKFMAIPGGILMVTLILLDPSSATIFLAMVIGLALARKIDNIAFYVGTAILLLLPVIFNIMPFTINGESILQIRWLPFGILIVSCVLDELGNDWADKRIKKRLIRHTTEKNDDKFTYNLGEKFFLNRFMMKVGIFILAFFGIFEWLYFFAFVAFDICYTLVDYYSTHAKKYSLTKKIAASTR